MAYPELTFTKKLKQNKKTLPTSTITPVQNESSEKHRLASSTTQISTSWW